MGTGFEQSLNKGRCTNGQRAREEAVSLIMRKCKNPNETLLLTSNGSKDVLSYVDSGGIKWYNQEKPGNFL